MAKNYITLDSRVDTFKDRFNDLTNLVGDLATLTTTGDSDLVQAINEHSAELGTITAGAMGTTASTVSTAIAELDAEADSDRTNFGANVKNLMLMDGTSKHVTVTANNSTNETTFITFVDGSADSQGIETDTGLTYNPSSGLITAVSLAAATLDISGNVDIDGTLEVGAISGTSADFDAGVTIDNLTIDGTSVASSSTLSLDAAGDITIDAGGAEINLKDDGTTVGHISMASSNLEIKSSVSDKDMIFKGNDGGSEITALTFDMANAGAATFNNKIIATELDISGNVDIDGTTNLDVVDIDGAVDMATTLTVAGNVDFNGDLDVDGTTNLDVVDIDGAVNMATTLLVTGNVDFNGNLDVDGTTNLDAVDIDGAVDMATTLNVAGVLSAASLDISGDVDIDGSLETDGLSINGTTVSSTATELNLLDGVSGLVQADFTKLAAVEATATELNLLDGVSGLVQADFTKLAAVTSSAAEINLLDGVSGLVQADFTKLAAVDATATELNIIDGGTSATSTTIADADRVIVNDGGTMKQVAVTDLAAYFDDEITAMPNLVTTAATTVGVLNSGSITSGFGSINVGSSSITTTGAISGGSVTVGGAALNETELEILDGALITTTELNVLNGSDPGNASNASITVADADALIMNDGGTMRQVDVSLLKSYFGFEVVGGTSITSLDIDGGADIGAAIVDADLFIVNDGATGDAQRKATASRLRTYTNAGTLSQAAQTNITSLGTLTSLNTSGAVNLNLTTDASSSTAGALIVDGGAAIAKKLFVGTDLDVDGTTNLDVVDIDGAVDMATTLAVAGNVDFNGDLDVDGTTNLDTVDIDGDLDVDGTTNLDVVDIDGAVDMATTLAVAGNVDFNADLDVDGTTNLDAVDIDGAVNMATTLLVTGNVDFNGDLDVDGTTNLDVVDIDGAVNMATTLLVTGNVDFNGNLDVDGTSNLDVVDIDGAVDMASTLQVDGAITNSSTIVSTGKITADAGIDIDNFNIDGTTIALSSGDMTLDAAQNIILDAGDGSEHTIFALGGVNVGHVNMGGQNLKIKSRVSDKDMIFQGVDGGSDITALTLDMSNAGAATFNNKIIDIDGTLETDALSIASTVVTTTAAELNLIDGGTARGTTAFASGDGVLHNDAGVMRMTNITKVRDFVQANISNDTITEAMMANDAIGQNELKTLRTFTLKDSAGSTLFTMFGAGA
jgi:cytoskeletal protein CcmA (bactofilin family)